MSTIKRFEDLECWKSARILAVRIYSICNHSLIKEDRTLSQQIKGATISISNNIAEGFERISDKEFIRFLGYSNGSCSEVKSMLYILSDLSFIEENEFRELMELSQKTQNLTKGLIRYLYKRNKNKEIE